MIDLENVSVSAGKFRLDRISLQVSRGEYFVLLGPSGAGKTLLLETIAGIRTTDEGKILIGGSNMTTALPERRGAALVYQDYSLFPHMTVAGNVAYGKSFSDKVPVHSVNEVDQLLSRFGIAALRDRYPCSLSGGEQQRVALARALAVQPAVLLLDEPFASLDPRTRSECMKVMQDLKDTRSVTIIHVCHSRDEAYALGDRAAVLIGGKICQTGSIDEIFRHPVSRPVAEFTGMENLIPGRVLSSDKTHSLVDIGAVILRAAGSFRPGSTVTLGIPADSVTLDLSENVPADPSLNVFRCSIGRVTPGHGSMRIELGGPVPLTSATRYSPLSKNGYFPGRDVNALVQNTDIHVIPGA